MPRPRDFKKEYRTFHNKPKEKKRRAGRNKARSIMAKRVGKASIMGKDIDHKDRNPQNNSPGNLRVQSKARNRGRNK